MELKILDTNLYLIGVIDTFKSFRHKRKFYKVGECELHLAFSIEALSILKKDNIIYFDKYNSFIIHTIQINKESTGEEIIQVNAKSLISIAERRINYKQINVSDTNVNTYITQMLNDSIITPKDSKRKIENTQIGTFAEVGNISRQNRYGNVLDELLSVSDTHNVHFFIEADYISRKFKFSSFTGIDRSINQSNLSYCIFSEEYENIDEQEYSYSCDNYKNVTLVAGAGEGIARKEYIVNDTSNGLSRYELYTDARDISDKETKTRIVIDPETGKEKEEEYEVDIPIATYNKLLEQRGNEKLNEFYITESFDSKISLNSNLKYKTDFDLGDIVTIINKKWGLVINTRITEIEEIFENTHTVNVTFGDSLPTLIDKIKSKMR